MAGEQQLGNIVYEVEMNVANLIEAQRKVNERLDKMNSGFNKSGQAADKFSASLSKLGAAISVALVVEWGKRFLEVADSMTQLQARIARLSTDAAAAKQTFSDLAAIASVTGASLADTTKLWESLTSSLKEAGATNAQVLNLTDTLQKIGRIGGSSTEEMANALRQFGQSIASGTIRAEEFNSILEQMPELARQIATGLGMSMGELRQAMLAGKLTAQDALNAIQDRTAAVNGEFSKLPRTMDQATGSLETAFGRLIKSINDATGASSAMVSGIDLLARSIDTLATSSATSAQKILAVARVMAILNPSLAEAVAGFDKVNNANVETLTGKVSDLTGDLAAATKGANKASEATKHFTIAATASAGASKKASSEAKKAADEQERIAEKLEELRQKSMLTAASTGELSKQQAILSAQQSLGSAASQEQITLAGQYAAQAYDVAAALKAQQKAEKLKQDTEKDYKQVRVQASPVVGVDTKFQEQMASLNAYATLYPQKIAEVEATRAAIEKQYRDQRTAAMWEEWSQQNVASQLFADTLQTSMNTVSSSITGILNGTQSLNDALGNIANTVLSSVVQSFVQMGVEWVKSAIMGQTAQVAATAATTAASVAGTATTTAASTAAAATTTVAWTPAAIAASIGSFGGAAAIGIGAVIAAMALSSSLAGKRKNGGPVSAGSMYQVGEGGMPEIYQASSGKQFMIPGDNGKVISNKDMQSGSGGGLNFVLNITNTNGSRVETSEPQYNNGYLTMEMFIGDMQQGGPMSRSITDTTSATRRATE
ncbi:tape measure domain-containing protein [Buttiauxella sp. BIGb0552]|uniref:tape measure protein n=1 Tax=Buttiauxella sp. BIGb0552 TaxID=2485120 RepID=UPI001065FAF7|nr:tape measure protein [Buttiauxella sp. BIGb0552]TDX14654.1 tape measure domain-containing protein [Buttiauxella sp. BIGb0552]